MSPFRPNFCQMFGKNGAKNFWRPKALSLLVQILIFGVWPHFCSEAWGLTWVKLCAWTQNHLKNFGTCPGLTLQLISQNQNFENYRQCCTYYRLKTTLKLTVHVLAIMANSYLKIVFSQKSGVTLKAINSIKYLTGTQWNFPTVEYQTWPKSSTLSIAKFIATILQPMTRKNATAGLEMKMHVHYRKNVLWCP